MPLPRALLELRRAHESARKPFLLSALLVSCTGSPFTAADQAGVGSGGASGSADGAGAARAGSPGAVAGGESTDDGAGRPDTAGEGAGAGSGGSAGNTPVSSAGSAEGGALGTSGASATGGGGTNDSAACNRGEGADYQLRFYSETQHAVEQEVHPFFNVSSLKGKSVELKRLKIRYYYTKEAEGAEVGSCFWVTGDRCSLVKFAFSDVVPPTTTANRMMELTFSGATSGAVSPTVGLMDLEVRTGFTVNHANLEQNNDYSFDSNAHGVSVTGALPYAPWDHVTLYIDGRLVWGTEPCPARDIAQTQ